MQTASDYGLTRLDPISAAKHSFATVYMNTGADWDEACDAADSAATRLYAPGMSDDALVTALACESYRYEDM